jgi:hypothetical protein
MVRGNVVQLWVCKWQLAVFIIVFPLLAFPLVMTVLLQVMPFKDSVFIGLFVSTCSVLSLRGIQNVKAHGLKPLIAVIILAIFVGLLAGFLKNWGIL